MSGMQLEVAANSVASALAAQQGGADRVELCTALELGGLTPTQGTIALARERLTLPIHVLIRPRAGDFLYDDIECEAMLRDIRTCKALGCEGVVFGVLDADGRVDMARCRALMAEAGGMDVTFHRAIDVARDPLQALEDIVALGCRRILTSGTQPGADAGVSMIRQLVEQADERIAIMPGGGITAANIAAIVSETGAREFHASAKRQHDSGMRFRRQVLPDMEEGAWCTDTGRVHDLAETLRACPA